jgi:hypothetical protein
LLIAIVVALVPIALLHADVGDPQIRTDHPWYPGELACSTFPRLADTQAEVFERVVGVKPTTDEQKALAAWLWRCTHFYHGEEGTEDLWGKGFKGGDLRTREYWTGMFAHGFGLCGTTHAQWVAEMEAILGHGRGRCLGCAGHNAFEVFLTGGAYGKGKWCLLDHDLCTVVFDPRGDALVSLREVRDDFKRLADASFQPKRQHGWPLSGLHRRDVDSYKEYNTAEYFAGYSGPPPMVHLRRGETLRRYLEPGLDDGKTFVFWGRNYNTAGIPGPERSLTWVNQPEKMYGSKQPTPYRAGQARFGNAVYAYTPDFASGDYREAVVEENDKQIVLEFQSPYIIAATPPNTSAWGIYDTGCKNGLVLRGKLDAAVSVSVDRGQTWSEPAKFVDGLDLTDSVKGHRQYWLRLHAGASALKTAKLTITTICQANAATMPRLKDGETKVRFESSQRALVSAGPNVPQTRGHVVDGKIGSPRVTLELTAPRGAEVTGIYAAAHLQSGSPPRPEIKYQIELSLDGGKSWQPIVGDWTINRRGEEPKDFWSQSLCWGSLEFAKAVKGSIRVRFRNDGGRNVLRPEVHLAYRTAATDGTKVTFNWADDGGVREASHVFSAANAEPWSVTTGRNVRTRWVEFAVAK